MVASVRHLAGDVTITDKGAIDPPSFLDFGTVGQMEPGWFRSPRRRSSCVWSRFGEITEGIKNVTLAEHLAGRSSASRRA